MSEKLKIWDAVKAPPQSALKEIRGGRLNGYTDISPQWRLLALTEQFGPVGIGWTFEITDRWTEEGPGGQIAAFVNILLYICHESNWSRGIPGTGGSMLVAQEKGGLHLSDEAFKMATTDAISVAAKALGVGSDVYMGVLSHKESKYQREEHTPPPIPSPAREAVNARIVSALQTIYGDDQESKKQRLITLTTFTKDNKTVKGKADYRSFSDKQAEIVMKTLEKEAAAFQSQDGGPF